MQHDDNISPADYRFLLAGGPGLGSPSMPNPAPDWLSDKAWADVHDLSKLPAFTGFASHFTSLVSVSFKTQLSQVAHVCISVTTNKTYKNYFEDPNAHKIDLQPLYDQVSPFQKMLVLKCLRPGPRSSLYFYYFFLPFALDLIITAMQDFITQNLGVKFIEPPTFHLASSYKDSNNTTPLVS
jgi:dynein heavy chain, axonemal